MKAIIAPGLAFLTMAFAPHASANGGLGSTLFPGEYLFPGQRIVADGCYGHLDMQEDGNLVLYAGTGSTNARWSSNTFSFLRGSSISHGDYAVLQADGNLVVYSGNQALWAASWERSAFAFGPNRLWLQDDGNLVIYDRSMHALWASNTNGQAVGQTSCPLRTSVTVIQQNTNFYGGDFASVITDYPMECGKSCARDSRCAAFSWVQPGLQQQHGVCWLKASTPSTSYAPGITSGYVRH
jgi:hypothetical protein